ncbi:MAG: IS66 family insertion sequence element accessory protein TnpB [Aquincola sp.]|uniref:IS66 family insertion sequence element accessory protein TnpB n=1 Tax=Aquincola tertiaricarbonis TaxID=391953 RepID=UPI0035BFAFC4|nr:IS66 family insertion sequence element accessory protein TnpB [Aquincola sp.]
MFQLDEGLNVYLHRAPVDFRLNINGLAALAEQALRLDLFAECAYVFADGITRGLERAEHGGFTPVAIRHVEAVDINCLIHRALLHAPGWSTEVRWYGSSQAGPKQVRSC